MTKPTCSSCPYWAPLQNPGFDSERDKGRCHIGRPEASANWPKTAKDDYCGEHPDFSTWMIIRKAQ